MTFERPVANLLRRRLAESPRHLIAIAGPRQVGKTVMVRGVLAQHDIYVTADPASLLDIPPIDTASEDRSRPLAGATRNVDWLIVEWEKARARARALKGDRLTLAIDEVQKIPRWSDVVKGLWDADREEDLPLHVILLGSSPWLMRKGLSETLAGRFERIHLTHWSFPEMQEAFDLTIDEYVYFGGYPGSIRFVREEKRWGAYVRESLISPHIEKDILKMTRVDKPALLKRLFEQGCEFSGQIVSLTKLQGLLQHSGNVVTLADYLDLLSQAGLLAGLTNYSGRKHRKRAAPPKLNVLNTALISAQSDYTFAEARNDRSWWGRLVESAVGSHLVNTAADDCLINYWRDNPHEVDFVITRGNKLVAVEVKSGLDRGRQTGLDTFRKHFKSARALIVGEGGVPLAEFLSHPAAYWLE